MFDANTSHASCPVRIMYAPFTFDSDGAAILDTQLFASSLRDKERGRDLVAIVDRIGVAAATRAYETARQAVRS
jgi:hypothetical protein